MDLCDLIIKHDDFIDKKLDLKKQPLGETTNMWMSPDVLHRLMDLGLVLRKSRTFRSIRSINQDIYMDLCGDLRWLIMEFHALSW